MPWPPDLADQLPAPRDDEPEGLRQDIADELADHLHSAFVRELHATRDEAAAKDNVLERFGNPASIATKLWFDAMWEKIMSQRLTIVALVVVTLASLGSTALTWFLVDQARETTLAMLEQGRTANAALVEQSRAANEALLTKLGELAVAPRVAPTAEPSLEWNQVNVRLYSGEKPGKPAEGFSVTLKGYVLDTAKEVSVARTSDARGMADMGLIRPGQHQLTVKAPWGEIRDSTTLTVLPGKTLTEVIACPGAAWRAAQVDMTVDWPMDLKPNECWLVCHFVGERRVVEGQRWKTGWRDDEFVVVIDPKNRLYPVPFEWQATGVYVDPRSPNGPLWPFAARDVGIGLGQFDGSNTADFPTGLVRFYKRPGGPTRNQTLDSLAGSRGYGFVVYKKDPVSQASCLEVNYRLESVLVTAPRELLDLAGLGSWRVEGDQQGRGNQFQLSDLRVLPVLGGLIAKYLETNEWGSRESYRPVSDWMQHAGVRGDFAGRDAELLKELPTFVGESGRLNRWKIEIPPRLLSLVRANPTFKAPTAATAPAEAAEQSVERRKVAE